MNKILSDSIWNRIYYKELNAVSINALQKMKLEEVIDILHQLSANKADVNKKSDAINMIIRHIIKLGYVICGVGMIDIINTDNYGFIRSYENHYFPNNDDIFIHGKKIRQHNLRQADVVTYLIREISDNDKRLSTSNIVNVHNVSVAQFPKYRSAFDGLVPCYPNKKLNIAAAFNNQSVSDVAILKILDVFCPIGFGQRGLIIAPPKTGKTTIFMALADSVSRIHSDVHVLILLVDERPEEVTDMKKRVGDRCKIFYSDFNESMNRHIYIAELCIEYAKRLCELGHDVVIFMDSLTRLARAYNNNSSNNTRILTGGVDSMALQKAKQLFGVARNTEEKGTITIIATCLVNTGSKMDDVIFEEFKGTGNLDIMLDRSMSDKGIFPAIDIIRSGTRKHNLLVDSNTYEKVQHIRKFISKSKHPDSIDFIIRKVYATKRDKSILDDIDVVSKESN